MIKRSKLIRLYTKLYFLTFLLALLIRYSYNKNGTRHDKSVNGLQSTIVDRLLAEKYSGSDSTRSKKFKTKTHNSDDYYTFMGLERDATDNEIKKSYKILAMKWHPDKHLNEEDKKKAETQFKKLCEAYNVLSDPEKRRKYDLYGKAGLSDNVSVYDDSSDSDFDPSSFIRSFFGNNRKSSFTNIFETNYSYKEITSYVPFDISLEEAYTGCVKEVKIIRKRYKTFIAYEEEHLIEIVIKPGIIDGTTFTYVRQGNQNSPTEKPRNLNIKVYVKPHHLFRRINNDLIYLCNITLDDALTGFELVIKSLDNRNIRITIDDIITPKTQKVVKGEGMPHFLNPDIKGDLIIEFNILFPKKLSNKAKAKIRSIFKNTF
ncbi:DnaJ domain/DnaJ C terminal domain containing protein, putative [Hepatocystis sp. ex Piliocolobus tephrosceles]|nr:DnaJ domain/DnaJ C terminal domain containing protein, putative [Hepatocystis sp. ex Piliocolobus tephrosceles]